MTMVSPINPITPVPQVPYPFVVPPVTDITPFTYRDGATYLSILHGMNEWITRQLIPYIQDNLDALGANYLEVANNLITTVNSALTGAESEMADAVTQVNAAIAQLNDAVTGAAASATAAAGSATTAGASATAAASAASAASAAIFVNVKAVPYNAVGDGTTDDTAAIKAAITAAGNGIVYFPSGTYLITSTIEIDSANVSFLGAVTNKTFLKLAVTAGPGIFYNHSAGLGGSSQDTTTFERLTLTGNCQTGYSLLQFYGTALMRVENIVVQSSSSSAMRFDTCQDFILGKIDMFSPGDPTSSLPSGAALWITGCNNVYINYLRMESMQNIGVYLSSGTVRWIEGKLDTHGNGIGKASMKADGTGDIYVAYVHMDGNNTSPVELTGNFKDVEFSYCRWVGHAAQGIFNIHDVVMAYNPVPPYLPGVSLFPRLAVNDCTVVAEAPNSSATTSALVVATMPAREYYPSFFPSPGPYPAQLSGRAQYSTLQVRGTLLYPSGASYVTPQALGAGSSNLLVGSYLVNMQNGTAARISQDIYTNGQVTAGDGVTQVNIANVPNGNLYALWYRVSDMVAISARNLFVDYRTRRSVFSWAYQAQSGVAVSGTTFDATALKSTVTITAPAAASASWVGMYLTDGTNYYQIRSVSGATFTLDFDQSATVVAGTYTVVAGHVNGNMVWND